MKKVAFYTAPGMDFSPATLSAVPIVIRGLAIAAGGDGWEPVVVAAKSDSPAFPDISTVGVDFSPAPGPGAGVLLRRIERKIFQHRHILHRTWIAESIAVLRTACPPGSVVVAPAEIELNVGMAAALPGRKFVAVFHDCNFVCKPRFRRRLKSSGITLCAVSSFCARAAEKYFSLPPGSVHVVYNAVGHGIFSPQARTSQSVPTISCHGRSVPEKGIDILLGAAIRLAESGGQFRVQLAGANRGLALDLTDPYQQKLTAMIDRLSNLGIVVHRQRNVEWAEIPGYLRSADIHVSPQRWDEPFGMATLEAMASGLATVASGTGGTPEVVGDAGLLFERGNIGQLATHLERLILDEPYRVEMGRRAHQQSLKFTWDNSWRSLKTAFSGVAPAAGPKVVDGDA